MKTCCRFLWICLLAPGPLCAGQIDSQSAGDYNNPQNVDTGFSFGWDPIIFGSSDHAHVTILQRGRPTAGYDFYQFTNHLPGKFQLDVDSAPLPTNFDIEIGIWNAAGNLLAANDDYGNDPGDGPGSVGGWFNSAIHDLTLAAGVYTLGVTRYWSGFYSGAPYIQGTEIPEGGTYTLHLTREYSTPEPASLVLMLTGLAGACSPPAQIGFGGLLGKNRAVRTGSSETPSWAHSQGGV